MPAPLTSARPEALVVDVRMHPNTWNPAARAKFGSDTAGVAVLQSVAVVASESCSPWYEGPPVHWVDFTTKRTCVAFVFGMSN